MKNLYANDLKDLNEAEGYETILNRGEVVGVEKMDVNIEHRSFFYFVFTDRHKYERK